MRRERPPEAPAGDRKPSIVTAGRDDEFEHENDS